jgi:DNA-binding NarL/FixJ family response regulator
VAAFETFGHVFEVARSRARLAAVLQAVGRPADAAREAQQAATVARQLGATPLLAEVGRLGLTPGPDGVPSQVSPPDALTTREHEVLSLVAQGLSNREVAARLYISAKTVSVHVSNILAKLGAAGRTEAAALARRRGLLT